MTETATPTETPDLLGLFWSPLSHTIRFADLPSSKAPTAEAPAAAKPTFVAPTGEATIYLRPNGLEYVPRFLMVGETKTQDVTLIRESIASGLTVLLYGEPGCGKTALVEAAFGDDLYTVQGTIETETADFVGSWTQQPDGTYQWVDGPLINAMIEGRKLLVDEIALIDSRVMAVVYGVMDGRGELVVTQNPLRGTVAFRAWLPGDRGVQPERARRSDVRRAAVAVRAPHGDGHRLVARSEAGDRLEDRAGRPERK